MQIKLGRIQILVALINIFLLLVLYSCHVSNLNIVHAMNALLFIPMCYSMYCCHKVYKAVNFKNNLIFLYITTIALFFNCCIWYLVAHYFKNQQIGLIFSIIDVLFYCFACICITYFILYKNIAEINILKKHWFFGLLSLFITISLNLSLFFCLSKIMHNNLYTVVASSVILISMIALEIILLGIIFCKSPEIKYILLGFLFTINCIYIQTGSLNEIVFYYLGQTSWYFGIWILGIGLYGLSQVIGTKDCNLNPYFDFKEITLSNILITRTMIIFLTSTSILCEILLVSGTISFQNFLLIPSGIIVFSLLMLIALDNIFNSVQKDFNNILDTITNVNSQNNMGNLSLNISEFKTIKKFVINSFNSIKEINEKNNNLAKTNHLNELKIIEENSRYKELLLKKNVIEALAAKDKSFMDNVSLLVHDIKSPTTLIHNIIKQNSSILNPLDVSALELANKRILLLTQNLLKNYKEEDLIAQNKYFNMFLVIDNALTEFRSAYKNILFEFNKNQQTYFCLLKGNSNMFERMIINLIGNAVDALKNKDNPQITINLSSVDDFIQIDILDNGDGIPDIIKEQFLAKKTITSSKANGNGMGLLQVSETLEIFSASCDINNNIKQGTMFKLSFPIFNTPHWHCESITLKENQHIIIFDDDISIHVLWDNILAKYLVTNQIKITHFQDVDLFNQYTKQLTVLDNILFLCDYDIGNNHLNGLDLIQNLKIENSILVTANFEEEILQEKLAQLKIKMLDKRMINYLFIEFEQNNKKADMVWLDDQDFFPKYIANKFYPHLKIDVYKDVSLFFKNIVAYKLDTIIILDFNLNSTSEMNGLSIAKDLHEVGFTHLIILTSDTSNFDDMPQYVKLINKSSHDVANLEQQFNNYHF